MDQRFRQPAVDPPEVSLWRARAIAVVLALAVFATVGIVLAQVGIGRNAPAAPRAVVEATAAGAVLHRPGGGAQRQLAMQPVLGGREQHSGSQASYRYPADGSLVTATRLYAAASVHESPRAARSTAEIGEVRLLGGRIVLTDARLRVDASLDRRRATGSFAWDPGAQLQVDGRTVRVEANRVVPVPGIGTVTFDEQAVVADASSGDRQTGPRRKNVAAIAHVRLSKPYAGLPAGSELVLGRVEAAVREGRVRAIDHPSSASVTAPGLPPGITLQAGSPAPGETQLPRKNTSVKSTATTPVGSLQNYVFPILGSADYGDSWGAARASTGVPHQGTDIFAQEGTPIVAVTDGVLDRVGWNTIGGYRFWLFDRYGNGFYHAHLSAFAPLARDGAWVHAGDVIGFVGHTGDAQGTPNHLHFEIHPGNGDAVNPVKFLDAWKHGIATALGGAAAPGALSPLTLLAAADIAPNSGLEGGVLQHVTFGTRPVSEETKPKPTDETLEEALAGDGISERG